MLKDVTDIYDGHIIHKILYAAESQYLNNTPAYVRYHKVIYDGMVFYVSLNTRRVYKIYSVSIKDLISKFDNKNGSKIND